MRVRSQLIWLLCVAVVGLVLTACTVQTRQVAHTSIPVAEPSTTQEKAFGNNVLRSLSREYPIDAGSDRRALLESVFNHLAESAGLVPEHWDVHLLYAPGVADARSVEGHFVFVWSGLFDIVKSEDELAGLLASEIAHALVGHTEPISFTPASELLFGLTDFATSFGLMVLTQGMLNVSGTGFTRWAYVEATDLDPVDRVYTAEQLEDMATVTFLMLAASRYAPEALIDFWQRAGSSELPLPWVERLTRGVPPARRVAIFSAAVPSTLDTDAEDDPCIDSTMLAAE